MFRTRRSPASVRTPGTTAPRGHAARPGTSSVLPRMTPPHGHQTMIRILRETGGTSTVGRCPYVGCWRPTDDVLSRVACWEWSLGSLHRCNAGSASRSPRATCGVPALCWTPAARALRSGGRWHHVCHDAQPDHARPIRLLRHARGLLSRRRRRMRRHRMRRADPFLRWTPRRSGVHQRVGRRV